MEKKTELNQVEITQDGTIQVRIGLCIYDGSSCVHTQWHRSAVNPGGDIDMQFSVVNENIARIGYPSVSTEDIAKTKALANTAWTPEVVAAYQEKIALLGASA